MRISYLITLVCVIWLNSWQSVAMKKAEDITVEKQQKLRYHSATAASAAALLVQQLLSTHLDGCHVLFATADRNSIVADAVLRSLRLTYIPGLIVDIGLEDSSPSEAFGALLQDLQRGEDQVLCRVFLLDVAVTQVSLTLRFLEDTQLFLIPNAYVIFIGLESKVMECLEDRSLWNSVHVLYLSMESAALEATSDHLNYSGIGSKDPGNGTRNISLQGSMKTKSVRTIAVFTRCYLCKGGEMAIFQADEWNPDTGYLKGTSLFVDPFRNMQGRRLEIVNLDWYPFVDFVRDTDEVATTVTPLDSVDVRMLVAVSKALNFTFVMRVPWDEQWGTSTDSGNWTGMIGTLQHHRADFAMSVSYLRGRMKVVDYSRIYVSEPIIMVMAKSLPTPPYLALIQPLNGSVWTAVLVSSISAGFVFWALQLGWRRISGKRILTLGTSLLHTWSILLEEPPPVLPDTISGRMFIGWWWVYCTLISVMYKSSLIAHLSVPGKSSAIDTFEQLLEKDGWTWGFVSPHDAAWEWFKTNENPTVTQIYGSFQIQSYDEQIDRLLTSNHVLITWKYRVMSIIASSYANRFGYSPFYFGKTEYFNYGGYGWAFRKNAPFLPAIDLMKQRLIEAGLINHWVEEMVGKPKQGETCNDNTCKEEEKEEDKMQRGKSSDKKREDKVVLSLHHLQSAFFVLILGLNCALWVFIGENVIIFCFRNE